MPYKTVILGNDFDTKIASLLKQIEMASTLGDIKKLNTAREKLYKDIYGAKKYADYKEKLTDLKDRITRKEADIKKQKNENTDISLDSIPSKITPPDTSKVVPKDTVKTVQDTSTVTIQPTNYSINEPEVWPVEVFKLNVLGMSTHMDGKNEAEKVEKAKKILSDLVGLSADVTWLFNAIDDNQKGKGADGPEFAKKLRALEGYGLNLAGKGYVIRLSDAQMNDNGKDRIQLAYNLVNALSVMANVLNKEEYAIFTHAYANELTAIMNGINDSEQNPVKVANAKDLMRRIFGWELEYNKFVDKIKDIEWTGTKSYRDKEGEMRERNVTLDWKDMRLDGKLLGDYSSSEVKNKFGSFYVKYQQSIFTIAKIAENGNMAIENIRLVAVEDSGKIMAASDLAALKIEGSRILPGKVISQGVLGDAPPLLDLSGPAKEEMIQALMMYMPAYAELTLRGGIKGKDVTLKIENAYAQATKLLERLISLNKCREDGNFESVVKPWLQNEGWFEKVLEFLNGGNPVTADNVLNIGWITKVNDDAFEYQGIRQTSVSMKGTDALYNMYASLAVLHECMGDQLFNEMIYTYQDELYAVGKSLKAGKFNGVLLDLNKVFQTNPEDFTSKMINGGVTRKELGFINFSKWSPAYRIAFALAAMPPYGAFLTLDDFRSKLSPSNNQVDMAMNMFYLYKNAANIFRLLSVPESRLGPNTPRNKDSTGYAHLVGIDDPIFMRITVTKTDVKTDAKIDKTVSKANTSIDKVFGEAGISPVLVELRNRASKGGWQFGNDKGINRKGEFIGKNIFNAIEKEGLTDHNLKEYLKEVVGEDKTVGQYKDALSVKAVTEYIINNTKEYESVTKALNDPVFKAWCETQVTDKERTAFLKDLRADLVDSYGKGKDKERISGEEFLSIAKGKIESNVNNEQPSDGDENKKKVDEETKTYGVNDPEIQKLITEQVDDHIKKMKDAGIPIDNREIVIKKIVAELKEIYTDKFTLQQAKKYFNNPNGR